MAKKNTEEEKKDEFFRGKWTLPKDFPKDKIDLLNKRYELIEEWETGRRSQGESFNEQFCADTYLIADIMTEDDSYKGKFNPEELYNEMCEVMKDIKKGKKIYSLYDEVKMMEKVMDNHRKKTATKK